MGTKWQANYVLNLLGIDGSTNIEINYPLTLEFSIIRAPYEGQNTCTFRIYNLAQNTREGILKDYYDTSNNRYLKLQAGYGASPYPLIFNGNIQEAWSVKESGSNNYITQITGYDAGYVTSTAMINTTISPGTSKQAVINTLVNNLVNTPSSVGSSNGKTTGLAVGYITNAWEGITYPRGRTLFGNTWQILQQEVLGTAYIDNGKINILNNNDVFTGGIPVINASTGLLSTPKRSQYTLEIEILFEPNIVPGQMVQLNSVSDPQWNGNYKVYTLEHRGIISGSVNGRRTTKLKFLLIPSYNEISTEGLPSLEGVMG